MIRKPFSLLALLPVLVSNLYSMYGVLFLNWRVSDAFFWFWCEFVLSGITTFALMMFWLRVQKDVHKSVAGLSPYLFVFSFLYMLIFASLFAGMAYKGEWKSWDRFPEFLADKRIGLLATVVSYAVLFGMTFIKRDAGLQDSNRVAMPFNRKMFMVLGLYVVFLVHGWIREWTTGAKLSMSPTYLKSMGMTLLSLKLLAEVGLFDRFFKRRSKTKL